MAQAGSRPGLVKQARPALAAQPALCQYFDRHGPVEQQVMTAIDHAHPPLAQDLYNPVAVIQECPALQCHLLSSCRLVRYKV